MAEKFKPIFDSAKQVEYHTPEMIEVLGKLVEHSKQAGKTRLFEDRTHGVFRYGETKQEIRLECDLNKHAGRKYEKYVVVSKGKEWGDIQESAMAILEGAGMDMTRHVMEEEAYDFIESLAWYLEQRRRAKYAHENPRRTNHWVTANAQDMRLFLALIKSSYFTSEKTTPMDLLISMIPNATPKAMAKEISELATKQGKSISQYLSSMQNMPDIKTNDNALLRVEVVCVQDCLQVNLYGSLKTGFDFSKNGNLLIIENKYPDAAVEGLVSGGKGRPIKEIIDLPWQDKNDFIRNVEREGDYLVIKVTRGSQISGETTEIAQKLPANIKPMAL